MDELPEQSLSRIDPVDSGYATLKRAEDLGDWLFYFAAVLSLIVVFVDHSRSPSLYNWLQTIFIIAVSGLFAIGMIIRLYLKPAAEDARRLDLISNSTKVPLIPQHSVGYYNNDESDPIRRLGLSTLENSLFSEAIAAEMLMMERIKIAAYVLLLLACLLYRQTDLGVVAAAALAVLSEQLLSKWIRLEWLRARSKRVYNDLYALFQSAPTKAVASARILDAFTLYETSKANAAVALSSKIFRKRNPELSAKWEQIKQTLGVR